MSSESYDFVVVGGGAGGLALAARLSEVPSVSVAVIEAGADHKDNPTVNVPGMFWKFFDDPELDWSFQTVKQPHAGNKVHGWSRGKGLGGGSAVNFGMLSQASHQDLDNWEKLGNPGWNWKSMLPYFRKSETYHPPSAETAKKFQTEWVDPSMRGMDGPIQNSFCESGANFCSEMWPETAKNAGYPTATDPRNGTYIAGFNQVTVVDPKSMTRSHSGNSYYGPAARQRSNLHVYTYATASKVNFSKDATPKAISVEYVDKQGQKHTVSAKKEIILSAGSCKSPQLLEVSGVGNPEILKKAGVDVVVDLPGVGENLQDHIMVLPCYLAADGVITADQLLRDQALWQGCVDMYNNDKSGPFAGMSTATAFSSLEKIAPNVDHQKKVLELIDSTPVTSSAIKKQLDLYREQVADNRESVVQLIVTPVGVDVNHTETAKTWLLHGFDFNMISFSFNLSHPFSRGSTHITSANGLDTPRIDPQYFSHPADLEIAGHAILHAQKLATTPPLSSTMKDGPNGTKLPSPQMRWCDNIEEAKKLAQECCFTIWHPSASCSMLPKEQGGVVDTDLKVYGVQGLRVCDASIFPIMPHGNITSLVYVCAEKLADSIKAEYGLKA